MKSGVKPLGRIGCSHLMREHVTELIMEGIGVFRSLEIAEVLPPGGPTTGEPFKHLSGITFPSQLRLAIRSEDRIPLLISLRHSSFPKIFLGENIDRKLGPGLGNVDIFQLKHGRSVWITNFRRTLHEWQVFIGTLPTTCKSAFYSHDFPSSSLRKCYGTAFDPQQEQSVFNINMGCAFERPNFGIATIDSPKEYLHIAIWINCQYQM